jgi:hypothetical protein
MREPHRFFERVEVLALEVLDDRDLERLAIVGGTDDGRERSAAAPS